MKIAEIEGIGAEYAAKLESAGIATTEALLERGASATGRQELAEAAGIPHKLILEWVNHADLMRIDGVGSEYADLLEAAGVDSPAELGHRNAANLAITLQEVVAARPGIVRRTPGQNEVARWIAEAATLPKVVTHGGAGHRSSAEHGTAKEAQSAQVPAHMPAEDAEPAADESAQVPASEPALEAVAAPAEPAVPAMRPEPATPQPKGLWARIKRTLGMG